MLNPPYNGLGLAGEVDLSTSDSSRYKSCLIRQRSNEFSNVCEKSDNSVRTTRKDEL